MHPTSATLAGLGYACGVCGQLLPSSLGQPLPCFQVCCSGLCWVVGCTLGAGILSGS